MLKKKKKQAAVRKHIDNLCKRSAALGGVAPAGTRAEFRR